MAGSLKPIALLFLGLFILFFVGSAYNSAVNSGMNGSTYGGCGSSNATSGPCSLSGVSQVLDKNSPFTALATGHFLQFISSWFPNNAATIYSPYPQIPITNTTYQAGMIGGILYGGPANKGFAYCVDLNPAFKAIDSPISKYVYNCDVFAFGTGAHTNWPSVWCTSPNPSASDPCAQIEAVSDPFNGNMTGTNNPDWAVNTTAYFVSYALHGFGITYHYPLCNGNDCYVVMGITPTGPVPFNATYKYQFLITAYGYTYTTGSTAGGLGLLTFFGFIAGAVILLVLSLGIGFSATFLASGTSASPNQQGTKLAQVIGFSLLLWLPFLSEFGTWLGPLGAFGTVLGGVFTLIFGVSIYWRATSLE